MSKKYNTLRPEELWVYRIADALSNDVHASIQLLSERDFEQMGNQVGRSADSVPNNLSEGCGCSEREFRRYVRIARKSCQELVGQLSRLHVRTRLATFRKLKSRAQRLLFCINKLERAVTKSIESDLDDSAEEEE